MATNSGRLPSAPGYPATPEPVPVSALREGIPSAATEFISMKEATDRFLAASQAKEVKFSEPNPELWRQLLSRANPQTLAVCKHLESEEADAACPCQYPGSVWADQERVLFTMGDQWGEDGFRTERLPRATEIATAQLLTCLYNNAAWLIALAEREMGKSDGAKRREIEVQPIGKRQKTAILGVAPRSRAQAIEARRAETQSGSVHESAVGNADAPTPSGQE